MKSGKNFFGYLHTKQNFFPDWKMRKSLSILFKTAYKPCFYSTSTVAFDNAQ